MREEEEIVDPLLTIKQHYTLPFEPHDYQEKALDEMLILECSLLRFKVGLGKTLAATLAALYWSIEEGVEQIVVLCPPILLDQWHAFLKQVKGIPDICLYRGTPKQKAEMDIENSSVILVSYNIFRDKRYYPRFKKMATKSKLCIIGDELSLKDLKSQTYKKLKEIVYRKMKVKLDDKPYHKLVALNATPLSDLMHVYNWCALFVPGVYGSKRLFEHVHVKKQDHWGNVEEWDNEKMMKENMELFSVDTDKTIKLPPLIESVVPYTLSDKHMKLYNDVKEECLSALPDDKIELAMRSMFSTLQRLVLVPREFGLDIDSPVLEYIHGYIDQMSPEDGLLIYTRHRIVSEIIGREIPDCAIIYGGVSKGKREKAFADLASGRVRRLAGNMDSLGVGLNLQMLNHIIYVELPFRDDKLTQSTGRVHRQGQNETCFSNFPLAKGTLQERIFDRMLKNGEDIDKVLKTKSQIKEFLS